MSELVDEMTETKHTPGPWEISANNGLIWGDKGTKPIACPVGFPNHPHPVTDANFNLIAAAPEMFEALSLVLKFDAGDISVADGNYQNVINRVRDAIAKARGEQSS